MMNDLRRTATVVALSLFCVSAAGAVPANAVADKAVEYILVDEREAFWGYADGEGKLAVGPGGDVYYIDVPRSQIIRFTGAGALVGTWGSKGSGPGEFDGPYDVNVHPSGEVYVVDSYNHRIQIFTADGTYVRELGRQGSGEGELFYPKDVAFRSNGEVLVGDSGNSRVVRFSADGTFLGQWGGEADVNTNFAGLVDLEVAPDDSFFVIKIPWIKRFSKEGEFVGQRYIYADLPQSWAKGERWVEDLAFGPNGELYAVPFWSGMGRFAAAEDAVPPLIPWHAEGGEYEIAPYARSVAVSPSGNLYVADAMGRRIHYFDPTGERLGYWLIPPLPDGEFLTFADVAVGADGTVYVLDRFASRIQYFDADGNFLGKWGALALWDVGFWNPEHIVVAARGDVYVTDLFGGRIQRFSPTGDLIDAYGAWEMDLPGPPSDTLYYGSQSHNDYDFSVGPEGDFYILDTDKHYARRLAAPGDIMEFGVHDRADRDDAIWGGFGFGPGRFCCPVAIAVAPDGVAYVVDSVNDRIQCFYPDGSFISEWGSKGDGDGEFGHPSDIALGADGEVYVADHDNGRFQRFTADGEYLGSWHTKGKPSRIAVAPAGDVYVITAGTLLHYRPLEKDGR